MPSPQTPVLDNFNRSENPLSTNWFQDGATNFQANGTVALATSTAAAAARWQTALASADQEVYFTLKVPPAASGEYADLFYRCTSGTGANDRYELHVYNQTTGGLYLFKYVSGVLTQLGAGTDIGVAWAVNDVVWAKVVGSVHTIYVNGVQKYTFDEGTPAVPAGAYIGFGTNPVAATIMQFDDFGGGSIAANWGYVPVRLANNRVGPRALRYRFRQPTVAWWNSNGALTQLLTLSATSAVTASFVKSVLKTLTATAVATVASVVRSVGKILSASSAATAKTIKSVGKILASTAVVTTATIIRSVGKILSASSALIASLSKAITKVSTLSATSSVTASFVKSTGKILNAASVVMMASMGRSVGKFLTSTAVVLSASLASIKAKLVMMSAAVSVTASLVATFIAGAVVVIADYIPIFRSRRR